MLIDIDMLKPHPCNNKFFDDMDGEKWEEFLESVNSQGIIEPIVITPDKVIVSGHQRVRACKELGIDTIEAIIYENDNKDNILYNMLVSNMDRFKEIPLRSKKVKIAKEIERILKK